MNRKLVLMLTLTLLIGTLSVAFNVQRSRATGTIYIRADGSVDLPTTPILTVDNITYTFTGDINDSIVIERDNIVVDGAGYVVEGTGSGNGITLSGKTNVTIKNTTIKDFGWGIYLYSSNNNSVLGNNVTANAGDGIHLSESSYNSISGNNITRNYGAILLEGSSNNLIDGNSVTETTEPWGGLCIYLYSSNDNILSANVLTNNENGIGLDRSSNNTLSGNMMYDNKCNYYVYGTDLDHFIHAIDSSNLVDGKPVHYLLNRKDLVINPATYPEIGFLAVINSTNVNIEGLTLTNNSQGLVLAYTSNSRITGNNITDNSNTGIYLQGCSDNTISGNNITYSSDGIYIRECRHNTISGNNLSKNNNGIFLAWCTGCSDNEFYHNNFMNNTSAVDSQSLPSGVVNVWDDGYPSGGNYWTNYNGTDANHDGIGDTPYIIDASNNTDHFPLMAPYVIPEFPSFLILPLFMIATLLTVIAYRGRRAKLIRATCVF